jgi:hypothetical protein
MIMPVSDRALRKATGLHSPVKTHDQQTEVN